MHDLAIMWFRNDLRLSDNPALYELSKDHKILPIYIYDENLDKMPGACSKLWLNHSLISLNESLEKKLQVFTGDPLKILKSLIDKYDIKAVYWNRCYEVEIIERDKLIKEKLSEKIIVKSFNGSLLWEPWEVKKDDGTPYKVFTPFYRRGCLKASKPRSPLAKPENLQLYSDNQTSIESLNLLPKIRWDKEVIKDWEIGEEKALNKINKFLQSGIKNYKEGRNFPAKSFNSKISPNLHFGEISPNQIWYAAKTLDEDNNIDHFCSELGWREFSNSLIYFNPNLDKENLNKKFDKFPWGDDQNLKLWQEGKTGYPLVDAGMRELYQTGFMHNRVRMVTASFLVKNLLIDWRKGEEWFWDCLFDADFANNSASWQWVAGCGADAAPYFRIFNPVTQASKFDPEGEYIRKYVKELRNLPNKYLFEPWKAPESILIEANIELDKDYPRPIIDLKKSRDRALEAYSRLKNDSD